MDRWTSLRICLRFPERVPGNAKVLNLLLGGEGGLDVWGWGWEGGERGESFGALRLSN